MSGKKTNRRGSRNGPARPPEGVREGVYFLSLGLENVRCFGARQTLDLSDGHGGPARWTILLGNNGTGKTTVLQALVAFLRVLAADPIRMGSNDLSKGAFVTGSVDLRDCYSRLNRQTSVSVRLGVDFAYGRGSLGNSTVWTRREAKLDLARTKESTTATWISPRVEEKLADLPTCYAYGAGRRLGPTSLSKPELDDGTASLFSDEATLRNAEEWLLRLDYSASKASAIQGRQKERLRQVRQLLLQILPEVEEVRFSEPTEGHPTPRVEFQTPYGWVPLRQLGYGYQTLIAWMATSPAGWSSATPTAPTRWRGPPWCWWTRSTCTCTRAGSASSSAT